MNDGSILHPLSIRYKSIVNIPSAINKSLLRANLRLLIQMPRMEISNAFCAVCRPDHQPISRRAKPSL